MRTATAKVRWYNAKRGEGMCACFQEKYINYCGEPEPYTSETTLQDRVYVCMSAWYVWLYRCFSQGVAYYIIPLSEGKGGSACSLLAICLQCGCVQKMQVTPKKRYIDTFNNGSCKNNELCIRLVEMFWNGNGESFAHVFSVRPPDHAFSKSSIHYH